MLSSPSISFYCLFVSSLLPCLVYSSRAREKTWWWGFWQLYQLGSVLVKIGGKGILSSKEYKRPQWWWCLLEFSCSPFPCGVWGSNLVLRCSRLRTRVMQTLCFLCFSKRASQFWSSAQCLVLLHYTQELSQSNFHQHWTCLFIDFVVLVRETSIGTFLPTILLTSAIVPFRTEPSICGKYSP